MVSKNYIPFGERSSRGREHDIMIEQDTEMETDRVRVGALLGGAFSDHIIEKLRKEECKTR